MTDIRSVRLLWFKGGLFVLLGCVASSLLLLLAGNIAVAVLLAIAVWAFCRAYYFAFYVIEKYVDPSFRFAGLTSVARYLIAGPDQYRLNQEGNSAVPDGRSNAASPDVSRWRILIVWFFAMAVVNVLFVPLVEALRLEWRSYQAIEKIFIAWLAVEVATCVSIGALSDAPLKYRLPISFGAAASLIAFLFVGFQIENRFRGNADGESWVILCLDAFAFWIGCLLLGLYRYAFRWRIAFAASGGVRSTESAAMFSKQVSIKYLLVLMSCAAVLATWLRLVLPFPPTPVMDAANFMFVFQVGSVVVILVPATIALLQICLSPSSFMRRVYSAFLMLYVSVAPLVLVYYVGDLPSSFPNTPSYDNYLQTYLAMVSYVVGLTIVLVSVSLEGARLVKADTQGTTIVDGAA